VENILKTKPTIHSLGAFTYSRFSKDFAIPSKQIKTSCLPSMFICNTLTQGGDNYFNLAILILLQ
jgi:hypothetical protein